MKMNIEDFFREFPVLEVRLPRYLYKKISHDYVESAAQNKGIIMEILLNLALRRIYEHRGEWVRMRYSPVDFVVANYLIDVKSTEQNSYKLTNLTRAQHLAEDSDRLFSFVLAAPEAWDEPRSTVAVRIHEVLTIDSSGNRNIITPNGSTKRFTHF